jgi:hypothetical protein
MVTLIKEHIKSLRTERESKLLDACKKIDRFGKALEPFFKILEIFVSSDPNWAATFWGAIRMVFLVSVTIIFSSTQQFNHNHSSVVILLDSSKS